MKKKSEKQLKMIGLLKGYGTQTEYLNMLAGLRWKNGLECIYCKSSDVYIIKKNRPIPQWRCRICWKKYTVTVGTVFHKTHVRLQHWFIIITLMLIYDQSGYKISGYLNLTQRSVYRIMEKLKSALKDSRTI